MITNNAVAFVYIVTCIQNGSLIGRLSIISKSWHVFLIDCIITDDHRWFVLNSLQFCWSAYLQCLHLFPRIPGTLPRYRATHIGPRFSLKCWLAFARYGPFNGVPHSLTHSHPYMVIVVLNPLFLGNSIFADKTTIYHGRTKLVHRKVSMFPSFPGKTTYFSG